MKKERTTQAKRRNNLFRLLISFLADSLHRTESHLAQVVIGPVVDIEVNMALDAGQLAHIGVLPELPAPLILYGVNIVVGYPVGVLVEDGVVQVAQLELIIGVDDGLYVVVFLNDVEPLQDRRLELSVCLVLRLVLHIEYGRQVAVLKLHLTEEVLSLTLGRRMHAIEMVGTTSETILAGLVEVLSEVLVGLGGAFGGLNHDKTDRTTIDLTFVLQFFPIDMPLVVGDVDTVNLVAFRIADIAVERTPAEAERTDKDVIEEADVERDDSSSAEPIGPIRQTAQKPNEDIRFSTPFRAMIRMGRTNALPTNCTALCCHRIKKTARITRLTRCQVAVPLIR